MVIYSWNVKVTELGQQMSSEYSTITNILWSCLAYAGSAWWTSWLSTGGTWQVAIHVSPAFVPPVLASIMFPGQVSDCQATFFIVTHIVDIVINFGVIINLSD